jgi:NAD(P)-dependent dehydrogenase (short-subunit alcohol dehydrogenase family)
MTTQPRLNPFEKSAHPRLAGKVALITGASRGIGAATARLFAREGAKVVLAARNEEEMIHTAEEIRAGGGEALAVQADVANAASVQALIKRAVEAYGRQEATYRGHPMNTQMRTTLVFVRQDGQWHLAGLHFCNIGQPPPFARS